MAGVTKLFGGGLSSLCCFDQRLGCDDEQATLDEQGDRILYYFPAHVPLGEQLRHVGMLEGFIAFSRSLSHRRRGCHAVHLNKRRYVFCEPEPDIWIVALLVNQEISVTPAAQFVATTDPALLEQRQRFDSSTIDDSSLSELLESLYQAHVTFYGSISRVLRHPNAVAFNQQLGGLRADLRRLVNKASVRAANAAHKAGVSSEPMHGEDDGGIPEDPVHTNLRARIAALSAISPVVAVRATLCSAFDFLIYYTDWSHILPLDGVLPLRSHKTPPRVAGALETMVKALIARVPGLSRGAILVDGQLVAGRMDTTLTAVHHFLRVYAFHLQHGTYVATAEAQQRRMQTPAAVGVGPHTSRSVGQTRFWSSGAAVKAVCGWLSDWQAGRVVGAAPDAAVGVQAEVAAPKPAAGQASQQGGGFHRVAKPAAMAPASLLAAAIAAGSPAAGTYAPPSGVHMVRLAGDRKPLLGTPYVSFAYLEALAMLRDVGKVGDAAATHSPTSVQRQSDTHTLGGPESPLSYCSSTGSIGPSMIQRPSATSQPPQTQQTERSKPVDSLRAMLEPHLRKAADAAAAAVSSGGASGRTAPSPGSSGAAEDERVFIPSVFALGPDTPAPSHRLLWYQHGLVTVLCFLDAAALMPRPDAAAAEAADHPARPDTDIDPERLVIAVDALRDVCQRSAAVEAAVLGSLDVTATAAQTATGDGTRAVFYQRGPRVINAYGLRGLSRRPRGIFAGPQAIAVASAPLSNEIPRHILIAWNFARRDALSLVHGGPAAAGSPPQRSSGAAGGGGGRQQWQPRGALADDRLPLLLSLACDRRAPSLGVANAVRRRFSDPSPRVSLPLLHAPSNGSVQLATRYEGAVAVVSRERAQHLTFALSAERTPEPPSWVLARAYELHKGYYGDATQPLHQRH